MSRSSDKSDIARKLKLTKDVAAISYLTTFLNLFEAPYILIKDILNPAYVSMPEKELKVIVKYFMKPISATDFNSKPKLYKYIANYMNSEENIASLKSNRMDLFDL